MACEYLDQCGFFKKFGVRQSNVWKGMIHFYCKGNGLRLCENRKMFLNEGRFPESHLLPTGKAVSKAFLDLP